MPYFDDLHPDYVANEFTMADWKEFIGNEQQGGGESVTLEAGEGTLVALIPWEKLLSFERFVLGWSYADKPPEDPTSTGAAGATYQLRRENPQNHPRIPWLTASSVSTAAIAPKGVAGVGTKVEGVFSSHLPVAKYQLILATVRFADRPWTFLSDSFADVPVREAQRNTFFTVVPSVEVISAEGLNNIKYANGPKRGEAITAPFGTLMSKMVKTLNWMWVPHEYISGGDVLNFHPTNILSCVGRVNSDTFLGHPPGTLLLQAPVFTRFRFPMQTTDVIDGYYGWNIQLPMQFFDPDRGGDAGTMTAADTIDIPIAGTHLADIAPGDKVTIFWSSTGKREDVTVDSVSATLTVTTIVVSGGTGAALPIAGTSVTVARDAFRGHQLIPNREDLKWYGAQRVRGQKLYPEAAFKNIFKHVSAP